MLLAQLYDQLAPAFPPYARKDLQTAVRVLAKALQCSDPQHCPLEQYNQPLPTLYRLVEDYLSAQGKGPHTIRNTKNNLSRLFRLAEQEHLFSLAPMTLTPQYDSLHKPPRPGALHTQRHATHLPYAQWPSNLQDAFTAFQTWATAPLVQGRDARLRKRMSTINVYKKLLEGYFGYLYDTAHLTPTFDMLFDVALVTQYVHWHVNDCHQRPTRFIHEFLKLLLALTRQYRPLPEVRAQLDALKKTIPFPPPTYNKADAWVPLATLEEVARSLWPRKKPTDFPRQTKHPGLRTAVHASLSLMLRLWIYIPYRQRNMREMQLGENLHKDAQGAWYLTFRGEQLKVGLRRGRPNVFELPFPPTLVPLLEDYLATWRPILLARAAHPGNHVFLTQFGTPYAGRALNSTTKYVVHRYTGKQWHPHIIRSVWATEWIRKTHGDFYTAAIMLNDKLETVIANYAHLLEEDVAEKAYRLIEERNGQGK